MAKRPTRNRQRAVEDEPEILVPKDRLAEQLGLQIVKGEQLREREIRNEGDLERARAELHTWDEFNTTLIRRSFSTSKPADDYSSFGALALGERSFLQEVEDYRRSVAGSVRRLESLREQLPLYGTGDVAPPGIGASSDRTFGQTIFVVHGHDQAVKQEVVRYLEKLTGATPTVLHEQPDQGRTVIEKFEDYANKAGFAVVLLTADDEGRQRGSGETKPRSRQNVVFELGFFIGALGRQRVAVLYEEGVELPSDMSGVLYKALGGEWKFELARELKAANIEIDANKAL